MDMERSPRLRVMQTTSTIYHSGLRASGAAHPVVSAFCSCGWTGSRHELDRGRLLLPGWREELEAERTHHEHASGHSAADPAAEGYHRACKFFHQLNDVCPIPADCGIGLVIRAEAASTGDHVIALDRVSATVLLRHWVDQIEIQAVIGARMARCTWAELGTAAGTTKQGAYNRWGKRIDRYEAAGLLPGDEPASAE